MSLYYAGLNSLILRKSLILRDAKNVKSAEIAQCGYAVVTRQATQLRKFIEGQLPIKALYGRVDCFRIYRDPATIAKLPGGPHLRLADYASSGCHSWERSKPRE